MKIPKTMKRYCKHCKKHTEHVVSLAKRKERGALKHGSLLRGKKRGRGVGFGNKGRWGSKPSKPKMTGKKSSKKADFRFTCKVCNKTSTQSAGFRAKKFEIK
ncbi:MAG: 50S ribosomal protein L44e [Candidatus Woesearchaeota archaeon]